MSRFAKIPVKILEGVKVEVANGNIKVSGPKGTLERKFPEVVHFKVEGDILTIHSNEKTPTKFGESMKGTMRSHAVNMIKGVKDGWSKKLELMGTGYRGEVQGENLVLTLGLSHPVIIKPLPQIKFSVLKNIISVDGVDREVVGEVAAEIRASRPPDPYKGKGIRYLGEYLKLKPGKQAAKTTA